MSKDKDSSEIGAKAPDAREAFNRARSSQTTSQSRNSDREAFERDRRIHETPVSKIELKARKKLRALPKVVLEPTPDGTIGSSTHTREHSENERRIHFLEKRLGRVVGQAMDQFNKRG